MDCRDSVLLIQREIDGRATSDETARLAGHVESCAACARELDVQGRLRHAFAGFPKPACPADLAARISARLATAELLPLRRTGAFSRFGWRQAAAILVTIGVAGLSGWFLGRDPRPTVAGPDPHVAATAAEEAAWVGRGVPAPLAAEIIAIKERYRALREKRAAGGHPVKDAERDERCLAEVLSRLTEVPAVLEEYRRELGLAPEEVARLLSLAGR